MAKLSASEAATAISHQVSVPGTWTWCLDEAPGLRKSVSYPSPSPPFYVADPPPVFPEARGSSPS